MQTTIVMQENRIDMFHSSGTQESFVGPDGVKKFLARFRKVTVNMQTQEALNQVLSHGEMDKNLKKLRASLKPLKGLGKVKK